MFRELLSSYPSSPLARSLSSERARRLRISWFVLGALFGAVAAFGIGKASGNVANSMTAEEIPAAAKHALIAPIEIPQTPATPVEPEEAKQETVEPPAAAAAPEAMSEAEIEAPVAAAEPVTETKEAFPQEMELAVKRGDTFVDMLAEKGVEYQECHHITQALRTVYNPRRINAGQTITVALDRHPDVADKFIVTSLELSPSPTKMISLSRNEDATFKVEEKEVPTETVLNRAGGVITSSFYETAMATGLEDRLIEDLIAAYSYDIDFQREIQNGNALDVLYEDVRTKEGQHVPGGNVVFASLDLGKRTIDIYRYTDSGGETYYYNSKGESVKKALLKTPINGARLSSGFGMRRHPVLGYSRMHKGVDFAAPMGTPIYAAGDGVVDFAGRKGGYGNYLRIQHNGTYATAYGHTSRFARGIHPGSKVKQGQIVAYVGTSGQSTGPHLHYEILKQGAQVNPSSTKFKTGKVLAGKELKRFNKYVAQVQVALNKLPRKTELAMAEMPKR